MFRPGLQFLSGIIVRRPSSQTMEAHINKIRGHCQIHRHRSGTKRDVRNSKPLQEGENVRGQPGWMPKLHRVTKPVRQLPEEFFESRSVLMEIGWQLPKNRAKALPQRRNTLKENRDRLLRHVEFLHVGDEATSFDRVNESGGGLFLPIAHCPRGWQTVKSIIDFDGWKLAAVKGELPPLRQTRRIK